jgi:PilZ domain
MGLLCFPRNNFAEVALSMSSNPTHLGKERREFPRQVVNENAEFLIPAENMRLPCVVANISAAGAKIVCDAIPPENTKVILFFKGGLSIEAVTTWYTEGTLGLRFTTPREP